MSDKFTLISVNGLPYITPTDRRALSWMLKIGASAAHSPRKQFELKPSNDLPAVIQRLNDQTNDRRLLDSERRGAAIMLERIEKETGRGMMFFEFWSISSTYRGRYYLFA